MSRADVLVGPEWLEARLGDPQLAIVEVDAQPGVYSLGHVPGAYSLDWRTELQDPVSRNIPAVESVRGIWRRIGLTPETTVVFYGDMSNWFAAFGYWLFRAYGAPQLRLLDGNRQLWLAEGRPLSREVPAPREAPTIAEPKFRPELRASWRDAAEAAFRPGQLLDVRSVDEYFGDALTEPGHPDELAQRPGHIPGAIGVPWDLVVDMDGRFHSNDVLEELFAAEGVALEGGLVTYCRIGERSAHTWFVLNELLGVATRNYDGSWSEWGSMVGMPIVTGKAPGEPRWPRRMQVSEAAT